MICIKSRRLFGPENMSSGFDNNQGAAQFMHMHSLSSVLETIISKLVGDISVF